jgi:SAM-dependent methyltransferase
MSDYDSEINFYKSEVCNSEWLKSRIENDGYSDYPKWLLNHTGSRVLEIGCGPCSSLYYGMKHKYLDVTCVDACANQYKEILNNKLYHPIINGYGEDIAEMFYLQSFDIVFMQNSLDHTVDPYKVVNGCLSVLRQGGILSISGFTNEGLMQKYDGLHKHNFDVVDGILYYSYKDNEEPQNFIQDLNKGLMVINWSNGEVKCGRNWFDIRYKVLQ